MDVLYIDNHLLVVAKPAGMLVQEDITRDDDLLSLGKAYLKERFEKPGNVFLGLVHRLDRPVSGVIAFARTSKAAARLSAQFRERTPEKVYHALVEGTPNPSGTRVDYLAKIDRTTRVVNRNHPEARLAELSYRTLSTTGSGKAATSLVEVDLKTGRAHQIRVQLAAMGHVVVGDMRYGSKRRFDGRNLALHSIRLSLDHPTQGERLTFEAPYPETWQDHLRELGQ